MLVGLLVITVLLLYRHREITALYDENLRDSFLARMEAEAVKVEEQAFQALLPHHLDGVIPRGSAVMPDDESGVLFVIITDSTNCSNGLLTDVQVLNRIHGHTSTATVQGYYMDDRDDRMADFISVYGIEFPIEKKQSWEHIPGLANVATPLVLAYDIRSGSVVGVHHPIPNDALKSKLFYMQWEYLHD